MIEGLGDSPKPSRLNHPQPSVLSHSLTVQYFVLTSIQACLLIAHLCLSIPAKLTLVSSLTQALRLLLFSLKPLVSTKEET